MHRMNFNFLALSRASLNKKIVSSTYCNMASVHLWACKYPKEHVIRNIVAILFKHDIENSTTIHSRDQFNIRIKLQHYADHLVEDLWLQTNQTRTKETRNLQLSPCAAPWVAQNTTWTDFLQFSLGAAPIYCNFHHLVV